MNTTNNLQNASPAQQLQAMQIMSAALIAGPVLFSIIVTGLILLAGINIGLDATVGYMLMGVWGMLFLGGLVVGRGLLPKIALHKARKQATEAASIEQAQKQIRAGYASTNLIQTAFLESPALFATVIVLLTGHFFMFIGTAFCVALMFSIFPTNSKIDQFFDKATRSENERF